MMHIFPFVVIFTVIFVVTFSQDFITSFDDMSIDDPANSFFIDNPDDEDIFADSSFNSPTDLFSFSSMDNLDSLAPCLSQNEDDGLSLSKVRLRVRNNNGVCAPYDQPSTDSFGIFGGPPEQEKEGMQDTAIPKTYTGVYCLPDYPIHLCCEEEGKLVNARIFMGNIFETMDKCQPGMCDW